MVRRPCCPAIACGGFRRNVCVNKEDAPRQYPVTDGMVPVDFQWIFVGGCGARMNPHQSGLRGWAKSRPCPREVARAIEVTSLLHGGCYDRHGSDPAIDVSTIVDPDIRRAFRGMLQINQQLSTRINQQQQEIEALLQMMIEKHVGSVGEFKRHMLKMASGDARGERIHGQIAGASASQCRRRASSRRLRRNARGAADAVRPQRRRAGDRPAEKEYAVGAEDGLPRVSGKDGKGPLARVAVVKTDHRTRARGRGFSGGGGARASRRFLRQRVVCGAVEIPHGFWAVVCPSFTSPR